MNQYYLIYNYLYLYIYYTKLVTREKLTKIIYLREPALSR